MTSLFSLGLTMTTSLQKAGIVIETWKLPFFERHLTEAGYAFENMGALLDETLLLYVDTADPQALAEVLTAAMQAAASTEKHHPT